jgi:hypothetical protein
MELQAVVRGGGEYAVEYEGMEVDVCVDAPPKRWMTATMSRPVRENQK